MHDAWCLKSLIGTRIAMLLRVKMRQKSIYLHVVYVLECYRSTDRCSHSAAEIPALDPSSLKVGHHVSNDHRNFGENFGEAM